MRRDKYNIIFSCTMVIFFATFAVIGFVRHLSLVFSLGQISMVIGNAIWFVDEITTHNKRKTKFWILLYVMRFIFLVVGFVLAIIYAISKATH